MPEIGDDFRRHGASDPGVIEVSPDDEKKRADPGDEMQSVSPGEDIEIAAGGIAGEVDALGGEFGPGDDLADEEDHTKGCGEKPKGLESGVVETGEALASQFEGGAAGEENEGVVPHEARNDDGLPISAVALVIEEGGREGHEEHEDGDDAEGYADVVAHG